MRRASLRCESGYSSGQVDEDYVAKLRTQNISCRDGGSIPNACMVRGSAAKVKFISAAVQDLPFFYEQGQFIALNAARQTTSSRLWIQPLRHSV